MKRIEVPIKVSGQAFQGLSVKPDAQAGFVRKTHRALRDAVRFKTLRSSRLTGRPFNYLSKIWDIDQSPWRETDKGDTLLIFQVPRLVDSAPTLFDQGVLFDEDRLNPNWNAFDLLGQVIQAIGEDSLTHMRADFGMLETINNYNSLFDVGLSEAVFSFDSEGAENATINQILTGRAKTALLQTPASRNIRFVGRLDMLKMSRRLFQVVTDDKTRITGTWPSDTLSLKELLGEEVLLEGRAAFRPNGEVSFIEAHAARLAKPEDAKFRVLSALKSGQIRLNLQEEGRRTFDKIIGKWPGSETDKEILDWLKEAG